MFLILAQHFTSLRYSDQTTIGHLFSLRKHSVNDDFQQNPIKYTHSSEKSIFALLIGKTDVWHRKVPFTQFFSFCNNSCWVYWHLVAGYLKCAMCVSKWGNYCMACWDLQLLLETSVKGPMLRNILNLITHSWVFLSWFFFFFHLKPHNPMGKINALMYIYYLQVTQS